MKPFLKCSLTATKANYSGQKVISQLKALRSNEIKHRMCLEARNNDTRKALIYYNGSSSYPDKVFKQMELLNEETNKSGISGISY